MSRIVPHLWFDTEAREAAELYSSLFDNSEISAVNTLHDTPSGDADLVSFTLAGQRFMAISAGPLFRFNPSVSFRVDCVTEDDVDALWNRLSDGGRVLMPLDAYPFSRRYGWLQDRYGLSWQVMHTGDGEIRQRIVPMLLFAGPVCGRAEEAISLYTTVFDGSGVGDILRHGSGEEPDTEGTVKHAAFTLDGMQFAAMDSAAGHDFTFNEAISLLVLCDTQEEIDHYWERLSAVPEAEQCGWLKDRYGLSWQIAPRVMQQMMERADGEQMARVTKAFLSMKKFDLAQLEAAYAGR
jgi:predicted 3-demethylubiquinone-9 3-methyltransferase (glyoxalase superfamily)